MVSTCRGKTVLGLTLGMSLVVGAAQGWAQSSMSRQLRTAVSSSGGTRKHTTCPCVAEPFFEEFVSAQRPLLKCTDNSSFENFVRLVATNIDLVVLFEFPGQLYCGWQPDGFNTSYMPVTPEEFDLCRKLMVRAANWEGIPCVPEL
jgi:hypothetical protein